MKWEVICFDLDDTIVDYEKTFKKAIEHCFSVLVAPQRSEGAISFADWFAVFKNYCDLYWHDYAGKRMTRTEYRRRRFLDTMDAFCLKADTELADGFHAYFDQVISEFAVPVQGIVPLLNELQRFVALGIITNGDEEIQRKKIRFLGLEYLFPDYSIIISGEVRVAKPHPAIFQHALSRIAPNSKNKLFIGDSWELDVLGALNANWQAIYLNTRKQAPTTAHKPLGICNNVAELTSFFVSAVSLHGGRERRY